MLLGSTLCQIMELLRPKMGTLLEIGFIICDFINITCSKCYKNSFIYTESFQLYAKHEGLVVSVVW